MVSPGSESKCSSGGSNSQFLIIGLLLVYYTSLSSQAQAPVNCMLQNICGTHADGVHDLDCFSKYVSPSRIKCVWKPGNHKSKKTYTLIVRQESRIHCRPFQNITEVSKTVVVFDYHNMTAEVFENSESTNCTRAVFRGSPKKMLRCGPPSNVTFSRKSGTLDVNVSWQQDDKMGVVKYFVRYKAPGSLSGNEITVQCQNGKKCIVENVTTSLVYTVQIRCETNKKCSQCPWSKEYTVPPELTAQPVIVSLEETDMADKKGRRLLSVAWEFSAKELSEGYSVTIRKASGEAQEHFDTTQPQIRLILSYSSYHLDISAVNNVSISPVVHREIPQREDQTTMGAGKVNVTVHSETSFTVSWKDNLIRNYVCYSVEWMKKGHKAAYVPFHQDNINSRTLISLPESLEPYERYNLTLHTRPSKDTCNMKHVNNSESTYGRTQFYFTEGSPVSAPNISSHNVTLNSVVLQWTSIPKEDLKGFLLGYIIYYTEYHHRGTTTERNITVDPTLNSYELGDLEGGTAYKAQISGFTRAGAGVRSQECLFKTNNQGSSILKNSLITVFAVLAAVLIFGSPIIKRAKASLWPSIPNPGNSTTMQKIDRPCELELLESINTIQVEEWDTNSLQVVEKDVATASTFPSVLPLLDASEDEEDSPETLSDWIHTETEHATGDFPPDTTEETSPDAQQTKPQSVPTVFSSDYTTMEMFQQGKPPGVGVSASVTQVLENKPDDLTVVKSRLDYIGYFSTSPTTDGKMSTIL